MAKWKKAAHVVYQCSYHLVWTPKYRYRILQGKTAIAVFQQQKSLRTKPYWGNYFWSCGYCVTTVGIDEEKIRRYVKFQEDAERLSEDHELKEQLQKAMNDKSKEITLN
jgi:putative transposase